MTLKGKGFFIWKIRNCENGNASQIAAVAKDAGLSHVLIKVANADGSYNYGLVPPVANALRSVGIQVWGWHYVYGNRPSAEADKAIQRINDLNLDGYVIDAESQYKEPGKHKAARTFMNRLRNGVGNNYPLALSSYRFPSFHPIPWNEFLSKCDYNMPQVYWIHSHNPGEQLARTLEEFDDMPYRPPIIPVGAAFTEHGWAPTAQDVQEFLVTARSFNLSGANFWEWHNCRELLTPKHQIWNVIKNYDWGGGPPPPPPDITIQYANALNSHDPNQVVALYQNNAVHVTAARTIVGKAKIKAWYQHVFNQLLPNVTVVLTGHTGSGNTRHFTWTATSSQGNVNDGQDTFGLHNDKIAYHYTHFTVPS